MVAIMAEIIMGVIRRQRTIMVVTVIMEITMAILITLVIQANKKLKKKALPVKIIRNKNVLFSIVTT